MFDRTRHDLGWILVDDDLSRKFRLRFVCRTGIIDREKENPAKRSFNRAILLNRDTMTFFRRSEPHKYQSLGLFLRQNTVHSCTLRQLATTINYRFSSREYKMTTSERLRRV